MAKAPEPEIGSESDPTLGSLSAAVDVALSEARKRRGRHRDSVDAFLDDQRAPVGDQRRHLHAQIKHLSLRYFEQGIRLALKVLTEAADRAELSARKV
jgi:hypothetical protein